MSLQHLLDFQELMFRAYVRNVMFFATLPYYAEQECRREHARENALEFPRRHRREDARWLR
jgi:radical SAM superfamily enzyme with C-terminal helix-hairpin-helix motif